MEANKNEKKKTNFVWEISDYIEIFISSIVVLFFIFTFFGRLTTVSGESMEKTLHDGELLLLTNFAYTPERGDIVVLQNPSLQGPYKTPLIKRVIATGGETIDIDFNTWTLTVNGEVIDEPYVNIDDAQLLTSSWSYPLVVPENEIFVMGDNRNHSGDSRSSSVGTVDQRCIIGKALFRIMPFSKACYLY